MQFTIVRENLLIPLQAVIGVIERRQTLPILANVLLIVSERELTLTGTDLEVELVSKAILSERAQPGQITVPAKKLLDITRSLPEDAPIELKLDTNRLQIKSGRSRFNLAVLPAADFPNSEPLIPEVSFVLQSQQLKSLIEYTHFCIAQQDVRYYLNGILFETNDNRLNVVATDGHRLAMSFLETHVSPNLKQIILPRKAVSELSRLLADNEDEVQLAFNASQFQCVFKQTIFKSRLIDGRFPNYNKVIPRQGDKQLLLDKQQFKQGLLRVAVLANEKNRGVRLQLRTNLLQIMANNAEQEQAEEEIEVNYSGNDLDVGLNVNYLLEALNALKSSQIKVSLSDSYASILIQGSDESNSLYVIMPMRL